MYKKLLNISETYNLLASLSLRNSANFSMVLISKCFEAAVSTMMHGICPKFKSKSKQHISFTTLTSSNDLSNTVKSERSHSQLSVGSMTFTYVDIAFKED